jgi:hypothetical protein
MNGLRPTRRSANLHRRTPVSPLPATHPVFSIELRRIRDRFGDRPVELGQLMVAMHDRGVHFIMLLVALPFVGPVPLPGFSIPFGFLLTALGSEIATGREPRLPGLLRRRQLPPAWLGRVLGGSSRLMETLEVLVRPRLGFVESHTVFSRISGSLIMVSGLFLMLPFPLPFSNSLPAWTVIFLTLGALGRDGLFFFVGLASFILSVAFFAFVAVGGLAAIERLSQLVPFR